jgi:hypothetical protein
LIKALEPIPTTVYVSPLYWTVGGIATSDGEFATPETSTVVSETIRYCKFPLVNVSPVDAAKTVVGSRAMTMHKVSSKANIRFLIFIPPLLQCVLQTENRFGKVYFIKQVK